MVKIYSMRELTKAEEQVMQILWDVGKGFVKDLVARFPDPKPAYNTVSTIVRILEDKGFIDHNAYGRTHLYYPKVTREEYSRKRLDGFVKDYFENSFSELVSFFADEKQLSVKEMEEIMALMEKGIADKKLKK